MKKLKAALIGCGRIGTKKHIEAYIQNIYDIELITVCDVETTKADNAANIYEEKTGIKIKVETDYRDLLNTDLDFVTIATESGYHYEISMEFLKAGINVLVEKPMALSTKHMDEMIEIAREKNLKLGVCLQNRFNEPVQELRKKIENGDFGRVFTANARILWNRNEEYYKQASWRGTWDQDGGTLMNQCAHNIDLLQWMLGSEIEEVYGVTRNFKHPYIETEDFGTGIIKFKNGSIGILEGASNVFPKNLEETLSVFGDKGTVVLGGLAVNKILTWRFENEDTHPFMNLDDPDTVYGNGHVPLFKDFAEAIRENREPYITGEDGRKEVDITLAIYKSSIENKPVKFPIEYSTEECKLFKKV